MDKYDTEGEWFGCRRKSLPRFNIWNEDSKKSLFCILRKQTLQNVGLKKRNKTKMKTQKIRYRRKSQKGSKIGDSIFFFGIL